MSRINLRRVYVDLLRARRMISAGGLLGAALLVFVVSGLSGYEQETAGPGLRGILPAQVPRELDVDAFAVLDGNWADWSRETAGEVASLYRDESLDAAGQRKLLETLRRRLRTMDRALADDRYRSIHTELTDLHGKLQRRVEVAEAALETLSLDPEAVQAARMQQAGTAVNDALAALDRFLNGFSNGDAWRSYLQTNRLAELASAGDFSDALFEDARTKLAGRESMAGSQREFLSRPPFRELEQALNGLMEAQQPVAGGVEREKLREALSRLVASLEAYEAENGVQAAAAVRSARQEIKALSLDGGARMDEAVVPHYFNYNLRVAASEPFLNRLAGERRRDRGPVVDFILGANVRGNQTTTSDVSIDLKNQRGGARFDLKLDGVVRSSTSGTTEEATIYTDGYHTFVARKEVVFDGEEFKTSPARISVDANNRTVGASTDYNNVLLLGGVARNIAMREARKKRPQSEAIARGRVADRVLPRFNREADERFEKANRDLEEGLSVRLREAGLMPETRSFASTERELRLNTRTMAGEELAGNSLSFRLDSGRGIALAFHESVMNNALDRLALAGRTMTETELIEELERSFSNVLGRDVRLRSGEEAAPEEDAGPDTFVFDEHDPIRIRIDNGAVELTIRAAFRQEGKSDIPAQVVTVPLSLRIEGNRLLVERGPVRVAPVERPRNPALQIARAGEIRRKIESAIEDRTTDREISITREGEEDLIVQITKIDAVDGWLVITAE